MYEVYALKYSERDTTKCQFFYREASHDKLTLHYFVWLILGGPQPVLVDTGFLDDEAQKRGMRNYVTPASMVERMGIKAADVPISLITHLHYDHWAGHSLFPTREFWIQQEEVSFWTGPTAGTPAFRGSANVTALAGLVTLNYGNRIRIIDGDREVFPGLRVHRVGGHTAGLQIVSVETKRGTVVLTSDASHFYHNVETRQPVQIITSLPEMLDAFETIDALAGKEKLDRRGPRPAGGRPLPADRARHHQDRLNRTSQGDTTWPRPQRLASERRSPRGRPQADRPDRESGLRRRLGAPRALQARPEPHHRRRAHRDVPRRPAQGPHRARAGQRRDEGEIGEVITHMAFYRAGRPP